MGVVYFSTVNRKGWSFLQDNGSRREDGPLYPADAPGYDPHEPARHIEKALRNRKGLAVLSAVFGAAAILLLAAVLALPHWQMRGLPAGAPAEPGTAQRVFAAADAASGAAVPSPSPTATAAPSPTAEPTPEPYYTQLEDWRLVLVNSDVALPEDYAVTPRLYASVEVGSLIYEPLSALLAAAEDADVSLWVASGYRSVEEQEIILARAIQNRMYENGMTVEEAAENALRTIQPPGHSEHHTGLAVDFNDVSRDFEKTVAYEWLEENAADYGFVQRYPKDKAGFTGIDYEAWHYRYVGVEHAKKMKELGMCLEEYCMYLKGTPIEPRPTPPGRTPVDADDEDGEEADEEENADTLTETNEEEGT